MKNLLTLFFAAITLSIAAQTIELRKGNPKWEWNNAAYFETRPKTKFFNWKDYGESWDKKQVTIWSVFALSGTVDGMLQAYHAQPDVFEKKWGVSKTSFFGSDAWVRNYRNNDPAQPHKSELLGNVGRDFWHTWNWSLSASFGLGSYAQGSRRQPWKYKIVNYAAGVALHSLMASLTYNTLRR